MDNQNRFAIDFNALKNQMEGQLVNAFLRANPDVSDKQRDQLRVTLTIFERHGIGAIEAIDIMREISAVYNE